MNKTFGLIKPNITNINKEQEILDTISKSFNITQIKKITLTQEQAKIFYKEHENKPFFQSLIDFMTSGAVIGFELTADNAVTKYRTLMGNTDPKLADKGTLRHMFATEKAANSVHGSDSEKSAERELNLFFGNGFNS